MHQRKQKKWLSPQLLAEVKHVFEPKYARKLSDEEVIGIANRLVSFVEVYSQWKWNEYARTLHSSPKTN